MITIISINRIRGNKYTKNKSKNRADIEERMKSQSKLCKWENQRISRRWWGNEI